MSITFAHEFRKLTLNILVLFPLCIAFGFGGAKALTQGFGHARRVLYQLSYIPVSSIVFLYMPSYNFLRYVELLTFSFLFFFLKFFSSTGFEFRTSCLLGRHPA
jgi:hypothetical protein